ncbi:hypothetical protein HHI36_017746 [Cryptolaemus montrouzieri]|uniref:Uncharacterized protein n=1 Tax=Cryptolaemus montrouzieri TaxID=559131 RepID=A0ABD2NNB9_9CUCU
MEQQLKKRIRKDLRQFNTKMIQTKPKEEKLSADTKKVISDKQKLERDTEEFKNMERQLKKTIRKDLRQYNTKMIQNKPKEEKLIADTKKVISDKLKL